VLPLFIVPVLALMQGVAAPPFQAPDGQVGIEYKFTIPVSNPDNLKLSFKQVAGEFTPGISVAETGVIRGVPTAPGVATVTIAVLWNNIELSRHDYSLKISPSTVQLLDPTVPRAGFLPPAPPSNPPAGATTIVHLNIGPLTTASDTIDGWSSGIADIVIKRNGVAVAQKAKNTANHFYYTVPSDSPLLPGETIQACPDAQSDDAQCVAVTVQQVKRLGEDTRLVLGFGQSGAASADSEQKFFFDFYINRPLPRWGDDAHEKPGPFSWWGNVRVASTPQQINSAVSVQAITSAANSLKINSLAQSAEFLTGLDLRLGQFLYPLWSRNSNTKMQSAVSFILGGGATGSLTASNSTSYPAYTVDKTASDYARLIHAYPQAANYKYISFIPPTRNQYDAEYFGGFKLVTRYADSNGTPGTGPPAMLAFTVGQNELVSGGELRGAVARVEAFFPLSTGKSGLFSSVYLFGSAQIRLHGPQNIQPYNLAPATGNTTSNTLYLTSPSDRDVYSIGLGVDLMKALNSLSVTIKP
jgi:hypothetical protein